MTCQYKTKKCQKLPIKNADSRVYRDSQSHCSAILPFPPTDHAWLHYRFFEAWSGVISTFPLTNQCLNRQIDVRLVACVQVYGLGALVDRAKSDRRPWLRKRVPAALAPEESQGR